MRKAECSEALGTLAILRKWACCAGRCQEVYELDRAPMTVAAPTADANAQQQLRAALRQMLKYEEPCIFALCDIRSYLTDPEVTRLLRDLSQRVSHFSANHCPAWATNGIPTELDKQLVVFDVPLPNEEDGARILSFVAQSHQLSILQSVFSDWFEVHWG